MHKAIETLMHEHRVIELLLGVLETKAEHVREGGDRVQNRPDPFGIIHEELGSATDRPLLEEDLEAHRSRPNRRRTSWEPR